MSEKALEGLEPKRVFEIFEEICSIPRESGNCKLISDYCVQFAKNLGLFVLQDEFFNVYIRKDAPRADSGRESVILQGHMDMVCEKNYDIDFRHDFSKDGLNLSVMDDYIYAKGTTLGADDGIAVAYILSILESDSDEYPSIEAILTTDEEIGMKGAIGFDTSILKGHRLINIDHEVEGELLTCSAGGRRVKLHLPVELVKTSGQSYSITVCGLVGGHSGADIDKGRGNANLLLGRLLHFINKRLSFDLIHIGGGLTDSAIPRESKAEIIIKQGDIDLLEDIVDEFFHLVIREFEGIEDNLMIYCENLGERSCNVLDDESKKRIGFLLNTVPDGIVKMSRKSDGLVKTSLNCGIMSLSEDGFDLIINLRSLAESEKEVLSDKIQYLIEAIGGVYSIEFDYPAWEYSDNSELREVTFETYQNVFGRNPKIKGFHAGLECGVWFNKIKNLDIVSFGPNIVGIHTPKERLSISSTVRVYELLTNVLKRC